VHARRRDARAAYRKQRDRYNKEDELCRSRGAAVRAAARYEELLLSLITSVLARAKVSVGFSRRSPHNEGMRTVDEVRERVRAEYIEMPGLKLTVDQVQRLCGIDRRMCRTVLDSLVAEFFLCIKPNGAYARAWDGHQPRPAHAPLKTPAHARRAS